MENDIVRIVLDVLAGLAILIPVAYGIFNGIKKLFKDKDYKKLLANALELIVTAEQKYESGADKKKFVLDMLKEVATKAKIKYDEESLSSTIDDIIALSKKINNK